MVEPYEDNEVTAPENINSSEPSSLGSYQWKTGHRQRNSLWVRLQGWKRTPSQQTKDPQEPRKKQRSLFSRKTGPQETSTGGLTQYLRSVSKRIGRKKEICPQAEVTEGSSTPPALPSTPQVPVWDIGNFSLIDGRLLLIRGEDQNAFHTRSRTGSCVSNTGIGQVSTIEADTVSEANGLDCEPKIQINNVKGLILKRKKKNKKKPNTSSSNLDYRSLHGSHESLGTAEVLDLTNEKDVTVRALHSSILGERFCFEVIYSDGSLCFGCSSVQERDRWIENIRRIVQPDKDNCEREESSLSLWIHEAKGLPNSASVSRARYFCEVQVDGTLYGRTTSKAAEAGVVFWGENFNVRDLPRSPSHVALHLLREGRETTGVGTVTLALEGMKEGTERWVPLGGEVTLRVRGRYRKFHVLPVVQYKEFAEYLTWRYLELSRAMEPILSAREKEELGRSLVYVLQSTGKAKEFLVDLGVAEISRHDIQDSLIFRENTIVTKAIEEYMKIVGQTYLQETLGPFVTRLYTCEDNHEVDPLRCPPEDLCENRGSLWRSCEEAVQSIFQSLESFPPELQEVFSAWQEEVDVRGRPDLGSRLVSASLFLRFLCPAILAPGLFNLSPDHPNPLAARAFTLVAKVLQNLANFTRFGEKEEYMAFMNGFLEQHWDGMSLFLKSVSDQYSEVSATRYEGSTDLAYELSALHAMLCGIFAGIHQQTKDQLEPLPSILKALQEGNPVPAYITENDPYSSRQEERDEPDFVAPRDLCKFRPLINKSLSMNSLMRERLPPPIRGEEKEKRSRRQVSRTQSVPAQSKLGRRGVTDTSAVGEKPQRQRDDNVQRRPWVRPSSTLPRRKSTVPWCRNEDLPLLGQEPGTVQDQSPHLQEIKSQVAENQGKQKDLEGQFLAMSGQIQELLGQLSKVDETQRAFQDEVAEKLSQLLERINALELQKHEEQSMGENVAQRITALEMRLSVLEKRSRCELKNTINSHLGEDLNEDTQEDSCTIITETLPNNREEY